jgi:site-specific recombinase XerD
MKGKNAGRTLVLHPLAKEYIESYVKEVGRIEGTLFLSRKGKLSRIQAWRLLTCAFDSVGLTGKLGTHCMRKSFANKVYEALDKDILKTQRAMGHKSITSTVSYLSFREEDVEEAILKI